MIGKIEVSQEIANEMSVFCNSPPGWENCNGDTPLFDEEYQFPNGFRMAVQVCPSTNPNEESCWTQGVLWDENGNELACTDVGESFLGEYHVRFQDEDYILEVVVK